MQACYSNTFNSRATAAAIANGHPPSIQWPLDPDALSEGVSFWTASCPPGTLPSPARSAKCAPDGGVLGPHHVIHVTPGRTGAGRTSCRCVSGNGNIWLSTGIQSSCVSSRSKSTGLPPTWVSVSHKSRSANSEPRKTAHISLSCSSRFTRVRRAREPNRRA